MAWRIACSVMRPVIHAAPSAQAMAAGDPVPTVDKNNRNETGHPPTCTGG